MQQLQTMRKKWIWVLIVAAAVGGMLAAYRYERIREAEIGELLRAELENFETRPEAAEVPENANPIAKEPADGGG